MGQNVWAALSPSGNPSWPALRDALILNNELTFANAAAVQSTTLAPARAIKVLGLSYFWDSTDTTSAHDGVTVLVSEDGRRYKLGRPEFVPNRVEAFTNTPPGSPSLGHAWLIGAAPSGAWAAHANKIAIWTVNGWVFIAPANVAGRIVYVAAEDASYQYAASGWRKGLGAATLAPDTVEQQHLQVEIARAFMVENVTTNAPPPGVAGLAYVVGPSPTGAWAGQANKIAVWREGSWQFYAPAEGWTVWDRSSDSNLVYSGSSWYWPLGASLAIPRVTHVYLNASQPVSTIGGPSQYTYSDGTAPTTAQRRVMLSPLDVTFQASAAGQKLVFGWDNIDFPSFVGLAVAFAIFRDADPTAIGWVLPAAGSRLVVPSVDAAPHVYRLAVMHEGGVSSSGTLRKNAIFSIHEVVA